MCFSDLIYSRIKVFHEIALEMQKSAPPNQFTGAMTAPSQDSLFPTLIDNYNYITME